MTTTPLHTGIVNGHPVRIFKAPGASPDLPWTAAEDLWRAIGMADSFRQAFLRDMRQDWPLTVRTVATADGIVPIIATFTCNAFVDAAINLKKAPETAWREFEHANIAAMRVQMGDRPVLSRVDLALAMHRGALANEDDAGGAA